MVENEAFNAFIARILKAYGRRIADGDIEGLREMLAVQKQLDQTVTTTVQALHAEPWNYSWAQLAEVIGTSRQAVQQRYGTETP